jgi:hypothetical protein
MTDPIRAEILTRLDRLGDLAPDMRFGQPIANLAFIAAARGIRPSGTWKTAPCSMPSARWKRT